MPHLFFHHEGFTNARVIKTPALVNPPTYLYADEKCINVSILHMTGHRPNADA